jgi:hypothetical protein
MTATWHPTFTGIDPRNDDLSDAERAAHEAFVEDEDERRDDYALPAPRCRCRRPCTNDGDCLWCGRRLG